MINQMTQQFVAKKSPSALTGEGAVIGTQPPWGGAAAGRRGANKIENQVIQQLASYRAVGQDVD